MASGLPLSPERFAVFLDEQTLKAVESGVVPWRDYGDWHPEGFDNTLYPQGELPLKRIAVMEDGRENYHIPLYSYSLASKKEFVKGPPVALLLVTAHGTQPLLDGLLNGSIVARPHMYGMHLVKPLSSYRFLEHVVHPIPEDLRQHLLSVGLHFVEQRTLGIPESIMGYPVLALGF